MKVVVFGATGKTGLDIVKQALQKGHEVTAFVRDTSKMSVTDARLTVFSGDVLNQPAVTAAVQGQQAVICSLGSSSLGKTTIRGEGTANIVQAMQENGVERLIVVSAMGTGDSWSALSRSSKMIYRTMLRHARADHEQQEEVVRDSGLAWTIARPSGLTDEPLTGSYDVGENIKADTSRIPRADVAHFVLQELEEETYIRQAPTITN